MFTKVSVKRLFESKYVRDSKPDRENAMLMWIILTLLGATVVIAYRTGFLRGYRLFGLPDLLVNAEFSFLFHKMFSISIDNRQPGTGAVNRESSWCGSLCWGRVCIWSSPRFPGKRVLGR